jgi:hypothetical protein
MAAAEENGKHTGRERFVLKATDFGSSKAETALREPENETRHGVSGGGRKYGNDGRSASVDFIASREAPDKQYWIQMVQIRREGNEGEGFGTNDDVARTRLTTMVNGRC